MLQHRVFLLPRQFFVWTLWISCRRWVSRFCSNYVRIKSSKAAKILAHDFRHFILVLDFCMKNCIPKFRRWLKNRFVIFDTFRCSRKRRSTFRDSDRNWRCFELFLLLVIRCKWIFIIFWYFIFRWAPKILVLRLGFKDANGFFIARKNTITYGGGGTCGSSWGCLDFFGSSIPSCLNGSAGSAAQKFISQFQKLNFHNYNWTQWNSIFIYRICLTLADDFSFETEAGQFWDKGTRIHIWIKNARLHGLVVVY